NKSIAAFYFLRNGRGVYPLSAGGLRLALVDLGILRRVEFESGVAHLGARRLRSVVDGKESHDGKVALACLQVHEISHGIYAVNFFRSVINLDVDGLRSRRRGLMIRHALVNHTNEMRCVLVIER